MSTQKSDPQGRAPFVPAQRAAEPWWQDAALPTIPTAPSAPSARGRSTGLAPAMPDRRDGSGQAGSRTPMRPAAHTAHPAGPRRHGTAATVPPVPPVPPVPQQRMAPGAPGVPAQRRPFEDATVRGEADEATTGLALALDVVGRIGSAVTLAAVLVVAVTLGGAVDGRPASDSAPLTVTFEP